MNTEDWLDVARERGADASSMAEARPESVCAVYLAGYVVECTLKAYLQDHGIPYPQRGSGGHDLRGLWKAAKFRLADLSGSGSAATFYVDLWSTDLRYEITLTPTGMQCSDLVVGGKRLAGWIRAQIRRARRG